MITFFEDCDINLITAVASAIAAIASVVVSVIFASVQKSQGHTSLKISLFERRYEAYHCFMNTSPVV